MNYSVDIIIQPYLSQDIKQDLTLLCYYRCPIDGTTESIVYIKKSGEDVHNFITNMKRALFVDNELTYEVKQKIISKMKRQKKSISKADELRHLQEAFKNNKVVNLNIEINNSDI